MTLENEEKVLSDRRGGQRPSEGAEENEAADEVRAEPENEAEGAIRPDDLRRYEKEFASAAAGQLYQQLQKGDIRAIKLYYDLEEQHRQKEKEREAADGVARMTRIAAVRRAVFGDEAMEADGQIARREGCSDEV